MAAKGRKGPQLKESYIICIHIQKTKDTAPSYLNYPTICKSLIPSLFKLQFSTFDSTSLIIPGRPTLEISSENPYKRYYSDL